MELGGEARRPERSGVRIHSNPLRTRTRDRKGRTSGRVTVEEKATQKGILVHRMLELDDKGRGEESPQLKKVLVKGK